MKITIIYGQNHKGSTYHIARMLADKVGGEITEFFLPRDFGSFCVGCTACFMKSETKCPHYEQIFPLTQAMDAADLIILASPVYVYHATGPMKAFLDHYGYRWMVHRPEEKMFRKQAVCISTAAGGGMKSTNKDMTDSLFFWGVAKIYQYGIAVRAISFEELSPELKLKIEKKMSALAYQIQSQEGKVKPGIKTKAFFMMMSLVNRKGWNSADAIYWQQKGWTKGKRPWN